MAGKDKYVLIFGDSITFGAWDIESGGWVQRLRHFLDSKRKDDPSFFCLIYNLGVSGDTTRNLLDRFEKETEARIDPESETFILISIGTNDTIYDNVKKENWVPKDEFKSNLEKLVNLARKYSQKIVLLGDTPVDERRVNPIPWTPNNSYLKTYIEEYNEIIRKVAAEQKVYFIDLLSEFKKVDYNKLLDDGDHPNSEGHRFMFEIVNKFLSENKII